MRNHKDQKAIRCQRCKLALRESADGLVHVVNGSVDCPYGGTQAEREDLW